MADVGLLERELTPELVRRHVPAIRAAPALLVDGNLQPLAIAVRADALERLCVGGKRPRPNPSERAGPAQEACAAAAAAGVPVVFEPVSAAKAARAARALHCIDILTPNAAELAALAAEVRRGRGGALAAGGASPAPAAGGAPSGPVAGSGGGGALAAGGASPAPAAGGAPSGPVAGSGGAPAGREAAAAALAAALPDLQAVLGAGAAHVLLTLGPLGAALCRLGARLWSCRAVAWPWAALLPCAPCGPRRARTRPGRCGAGGAVLVAHMPALPAEVANCLGAGDCLAAGVLMRLMEGGSPVDALAHGLVRRGGPRDRGLHSGSERALRAVFSVDRQGSYERPALPA